MKFLFAASLLTACAASAPPTTTGPAETEFTFRGQVADHTVTHVVAVGEVDRAITRVIVPVQVGRFVLPVAPAQPWLIVFIDDSQIGVAKTVGVLRAGTLDAMVAAAPGEVELGAVRFAAGTATAELDDVSLHTALGLDEATAASLGAMDDFATRYENVDLDDDGVFDGYQGGFGARLDILAGMRLDAHARTPSIADLIAGPSDMTYLGASITARMPESFGAFTLDTASVTFDAPFFGLASGVGTPVAPANRPIRGADLVAGTNHNFGVYGRYNHPLPSGDYRFSVPGGTLEFTGVNADARPALAPFVRFEMAAACPEAGCVPDAIHFAWMALRSGAWVAATEAEMALLRPSSTVGILQTGAMGVTYHTYGLPPGVATGTLAWDGGGTFYSTAVAAQPIADVQFMTVRYRVALGMEGDASFAITPVQVAPSAAQ